MEGKRTLHSIALKNLLSFGPEGVEIELQPLNVLIGPNGSGKSNFLEAFRLLQALPRDLTVPIREGGGIEEWLWKGSDNLPVAELFVEIETDGDVERLEYRLQLDSARQRVSIVNEIIALRDIHDGTRNLIYDFRSGRPVAYDASGGATKFSDKDFKFNQSILSQHRGYRVIDLVRLFQSIKLYVDMGLGRFTASRKPQNTDLDPSFLEEDTSNLALVLNYLDSKPGVMNAIVEKLKLFYERVKDIKTTVFGNTIMVYLEERGLRHTVPATRLSDGTLRFLCLLTILCHPEPPPLVCIEEPELGMHPDIIPTIADLLIEASQRTQLIVTTHSDLLVSKLRDVPESILVCERGENGTTMRRLDAKELESWPEDYSLGEIWLKGAIGGTRW